MILEVAFLQVKEGLEKQFENDFAVAGEYISVIEGNISHSLRKWVEKVNKYLLLVEWENLEGHSIGFRQSPKYRYRKKLLHHYYYPFPAVEHYEVNIENK